MDQAEHFCGVAIKGYPTSGAGAACSRTSPRWYIIRGLGLNPLNKLAYAVDMDGYTVTSAPIPDVSTGNVELIAGAMGCANSAACLGSTTGTFASTRFNGPHGMLIDAQLLPKFYVGDIGNYRLVELDLNTQTSSNYVGTNTQGPTTNANGFN
eukprot:PhM_4_TR16794/c1_g4_i2/m.50606